MTAPVYRRIAEDLRLSIAEGQFPAGRRLPSERSLAERYHVTRQTVRCALQHLRTHGLLVTDRTGSYACRRTGIPALPPLGPAEQPTFPGGATPLTGDASRTGRLTAALPPPELAPGLGVAPGERAPVLHSRTVDDSGAVIQEAVSYFSIHALTAAPQLTRAFIQGGAEDRPALTDLYQWLTSAGLTLTRHERMSPAPTPEAEVAPVSGWVSVRRLVSDQHQRLLEATDLRCDLTRSTLVHRSPLLTP
ncbi:hypothetical protein GCM10010334_44510 [Streptomyces finlayi]|uniref:HTH gntR-type domain-containing protein n=1 Tax=Streptomyces finlayi TaxID=67296 RepID=A0A918X093_9ACTN|nr:GntR family transcriptional regulator [Streptomyces finlayi]GHD00170.1 hypothetical protein GCM10010334_44510 [Streptomyces finlayi]